MRNTLYIGSKKHIELPKGGCFVIEDDERHLPRARVFDPLKHSFNPLKDIDYRKARQLAEIFYTAYPQGDNTLTVRNGKRALMRALLDADRLDKVDGDEEVKALIDDLLVSPVLKRMLCNPTNFSFKPRSTILAKVNRAELGEFDALVIGLLLMAQFKGQLVVPDLGFYGRDIHTSLLRENRLIGGVNSLGELPERLRRQALLIPDKVARGALYDDAVELAKLKGLVPQTNEFNDAVREAMT
jgi:hypothetical protein